MMQAPSREQGKDHIILTINILWQMWKARSRKLLEAINADPRSTFQKAQQEWMEFDGAKMTRGVQRNPRTSNKGSQHGNLHHKE